MSYPFVNYIIVMDIIISGYSIKNSSFSFFLFKRLETQLLTYQRRNLWKCSFRYRGLLIADETGHTTRPGIFASGDVVNGARSRIAFHFKIFGQQKQQIHDLSSWICCFFSLRSTVFALRSAVFLLHFTSAVLLHWLPLSPVLLPEVHSDIPPVTLPEAS